MANKFYAAHSDKEPNKYNDNETTSACFFPGYPHSSQSKKAGSIIKKPIKIFQYSWMVQLSCVHSCARVHTHKHTLSSRYLLTALVRIVFTSLSTSSPLSTVYFKFHFIGRFISAKRMSVWLTMCTSLCLCVNVWFFRMKKKWTKKTHIARASSLQCVRQTRVMEHERTGAIVWAKECLWCSVRVSEWVSSHMYVRIVEIHCVKWSYLTFS